MERRLGRGLNGMIPDLIEADHSGEGMATVAVDRIQNNPFQPRKAFDQDELNSLSESIRTHGVLQPLVVRQTNEGYQLIAGERRLRAAQAAGIGEVPVRIVDFNDQQVLEAALVENIQRADLNPIEKAQGFKDYLNRFHMTQEQLAARLGLDRTTISNLVNLLELQPEVQEAVRLGQITLGHAKLLKGVTDRARQVSLCKEIITRGHSVRATEAIIKQEKEHPEPEEEVAKPSGPEKTSHVIALEDKLRKKLAVRVEIRLRAKDKGQIVLGFESNDDFERLMEVLRAEE
jgi:ParB family chromosome partitioning protein